MQIVLLIAPVILLTLIVVGVLAIVRRSRMRS
jgi:hypothetical protein